MAQYLHILKQIIILTKKIKKMRNTILHSLGFNPLMSFFDDAVDNFVAKSLVENIKKSNESKSYKLEYEIPGFNKEDVSVTIKNDILFITAENEKRSFFKKIILNDICDYNAVTSKLENGILYIEIPFKLDKKTDDSIKIKID